MKEGGLAKIRRSKFEELGKLKKKKTLRKTDSIDDLGICLFGAEAD